MKFTVKETKNAKIFLFLIFILVILGLLFFLTIPTDFLLSFANGFTVDGVCDTCSERNFEIFKIVCGFFIVFFLVMLLFITKVFNFLKKVSFSTIFIILFVLAGFLIFHNLGAHSLHGDEAWVASSILEPTISNMLFYDFPPQSTPPLFLLVIRAFIDWFGENELVFRFLPFLFGLGSMALIYLLMKKFTKNKVIQLLVFSFFAFNPLILRYSQELKPYIGDVFFVLLLFFLTEQLIERTNFKNWLLLIVSSLVGLGFSYALIFVLPAVNFRLLFSRKFKAKIGLLFYDGILLLEFILLYLFVITPNLAVSLVNYWEDYFIADLSFGGIITFVLSKSYSFFPYLFKLSGFMFLLFLLGILLVIFTRKYGKFLGMGWYFVIPLPFVLFAALLNKFPFGGVRADLFLIPLIFVFVRVGIYFIVNWLIRNRIIKRFVYLFIILIPLIFAFSFHFLMPLEIEEMQPVVNYYVENKQDNDFTYVYRGVNWAFSYYYKDNITDRFFIGDPEIGYDPDLLEVVSSSEGERLWLLLGHQDRDLRVGMVEMVNNECILLSSYQKVNAEAHLFQC